MPAASAAKPVPATKPTASDDPPPFSDDDLPPWETDSFEQVPPDMAAAPVAAPATTRTPAPATMRTEPPVRSAPVRAEPPVRSAPPAAGGDAAVKEQFLAVANSKVSGAVRTYLKLADMEVVGGVLHIACREESMLFMKKPAVQEVLSEAAKACGYTAAAVRKMGDPIPGSVARQASEKAAEAPKPAADPMAEILARARALGVEVK